MFKFEKVTVSVRVLVKIVEIKVPLVPEYKAKVTLIGEYTDEVIKYILLTLTKTSKLSKTVIG